MPTADGLKVGFNAALLSPGRDYRAAGIHHYIVDLLSGLAEIDSLRVTAFAAAPRAREALPAAVEVRSAPAWSRGRVGRIAWEQTGLRGALRETGSDLYHGAAYAMPLGCGVPAVVTVHDLSFFRLPHTLPSAQAFYLRAATRHAARRATALIAVSRFTAEELSDVLAVAPERVRVVPNGYARRFRPASDEEASRSRASLGLPERFVLTVGTLQPRKNLGVLLDAYRRLLRQRPDAPHLVVAGPPGWGETDVAAAADRLGIGDRVIVVGYVPATDLPGLYTAAEVFAYPSRYEGFGLPVLEAMACGTPVIASRASSLPEVAGDAAILADPDQPADWLSAMARLLDDPSRRAELVDAGVRRARDYSWSTAAGQTAAVYAEALSRHAARSRRSPTR